MLEVAPSALLTIYTARVANMYGLDPAQIFARRREPIYVESRWIIWLALNRDGWSIASICRLVGYDHATISHGVSRGRMRDKVDKAARQIRQAVVPERLGAAFADL